MSVQNSTSNRNTVTIWMIVTHMMLEEAGSEAVLGASVASMNELKMRSTKRVI